MGGCSMKNASMTRQMSVKFSFNLTRVSKLSIIYIGILMTVLLFGCTSDEIIDIEAKNQYDWQKYMNEDEFNQLQNGMSYMEVVRIVGGAGKKVASETYEWPDEKLMTQAYEIKFNQDRLIEKKIIEKRGHSER